MAYEMQAFKRACAIISKDETTAGAGNLCRGPRFVAEEEFGGRWWVAMIPQMTPRHAITGKNWEGVGVISDVIVDEGEDELEVARRMAVETLGLVGNVKGHDEL